jgi:hypothetical protein
MIVHARPHLRARYRDRASINFIAARMAQRGACDINFMPDPR